MNHDDYYWILKVRYYLTTTSLYGLTIVGLWFTVQLGNPPTTQVAAASIPIQIVKKEPEKPKVTLITGKPTRIVVQDSSIDLPVSDGYYNEADGSWTLSDDHAEFAMMSFLPNNISGNTFIYGHGTDAVFGRFGTQPPIAGSIAKVYTDNGHILNYEFESTQNLSPNDTSVLDYSGPSTLTIQTCTGNFSEWRSMFHYRFSGVDA